MKGGVAFAERGGHRVDEEKRCTGESSCQALHKLRFQMVLGVNGRLTGRFVSQAECLVECQSVMDCVGRQEGVSR